MDVATIEFHLKDKGGREQEEKKNHMKKRFLEEWIQLGVANEKPA